MMICEKSIVCAKKSVWPSRKRLRGMKETLLLKTRGGARTLADRRFLMRREKAKPPSLGIERPVFCAVVHKNLKKMRRVRMQEMLLRVF